MLERAFNPNTRGPLELIARYRTPGAVRRAGRKRIVAYLQKRGVATADALAGRTLVAAGSQDAELPGWDVAASIVAELAEEVLALKGRVAALDRELERRFYEHPEARFLDCFHAEDPSVGKWARRRL